MVVACALGALYNRESVLRYLLGKLSFPYNNQAKVKEAFGHITSLRCVFDIQLAEDPSLVARGGTSATTTASAMAGWPDAEKTTVRWLTSLILNLAMLLRLRALKAASAAFSFMYRSREGHM